MKNASVRVTLTLEQAAIAADLLEICRRKIPYFCPDNTEERWTIAAQLAQHQSDRLRNTVQRLRAALGRAR